MTITFTFHGKSHTGTLKPVFGASGETWHLMIDKFYRGRLRKVQGKFVFDGEFSELAEEFGRKVEENVSHGE